MSPKEFRGGYIAIARGIFNHPLFNEKREFSRMEAWQWLIEQAAWKPKGQRVRRGVVDVVRGQVVVAVRNLGETWGWSKSNVGRFLHELAAEGMIGIKKAAVNPVGGTKTGTNYSTSKSLITICNYEKYQPASKVLGQTAGQTAGQLSQQALPFAAEFASETDKQSNKESRGAAEKARSKPHHGAKSRCGKFVWWDYGTSDWATFGDDYRSVHGTELMPERYIGGRGNWFVILGEIMRPKRKRRA